MLLMPILLLASCQANQPASLPSQPIEQRPVEKPAEAPSQDQPSTTAEETAKQVVKALKDRDMHQFSQNVHPSKGVRFTPYSYVKTSDLTFSSQQIATIMIDPTLYHWGEYDGSGDPMDLTFADYFARFVYDQDYAQPEQLSINQRLGQGNSIDNSVQFYPNATIIEYHFSGFDPQYQGMDWRSLRIVLEEHNGQWFVVGIIHDEWTI